MSNATLPDPIAFGLPEQFVAWRPGQIAALEHIVDSSARFPGLVLPTGFGKSLVYMAAAKMTGKRTVILTRTRALQSQLMHDFAVLSAALVQGQRAYSCKALQLGGEHYSKFVTSVYGHLPTVEDGPCHAGLDCTLKAIGCSYFDAVRDSLTAPIVITNYAWWMTMLGNPLLLQNFVPPDLLVLDEAHEAPSALADAIGATIRTRDVSDALKEKLPMAKDRDASHWHIWAQRSAAQLAKYLDGVKPRTSEAMRQVRRSQHLQRALTRVSEINPGVLLVSDDAEGIKFDVVWPAEYAERWLFRHIPTVVLCSATFTSYTASMLGIAPRDLAVFETAEGFDPDRRPVYVVGDSPRVDHRMSAGDEQYWLILIDQILDARRDRKAIIHCVSYKRRDVLMAKSAHRARMITHGRHDTADVISKFREAPPGTILVSPSVTTGYDFPYDTCELQIIVKVPFPDTRDGVVAARTTVEPRYGIHVAMQEIVQTVGRAMRAADDRCENFIVDGHAKWFLAKHADLAPRWFRKAIRRISTLPTPPPPLERTRPAA